MSDRKFGGMVMYAYRRRKERMRESRDWNEKPVKARGKRVEGKRVFGDMEVSVRVVGSVC